ncbi:hypothetical protein [Cupriavidus basilensis]|nr:hypothetical protein [Cupriavidus basilensis]MDF3881278.1 hypothetical protein [Cupriavidus basilensis]
MNAFPPEQFTATQQANVAVMFGLANKALESFERLDSPCRRLSLRRIV